MLTKNCIFWVKRTFLQKTLLQKHIFFQKNVNLTKIIHFHQKLYILTKKCTFWQKRAYWQNCTFRHNLNEKRTFWPKRKFSQKHQILTKNIHFDKNHFEKNAHYDLNRTTCKQRTFWKKCSILENNTSGNSNKFWPKTIISTKMKYFLIIAHIGKKAPSDYFYHFSFPSYGRLKSKTNFSNVFLRPCLLIPLMHCS